MVARLRLPRDPGFRDALFALEPTGNRFGLAAIAVLADAHPEVGASRRDEGGIALHDQPLRDRFRIGTPAYGRHLDDESAARGLDE